MTAEIGILNKHGIALAADSAVTIGGRKIYNSANKLFTLSKYHPIGIMIYGNAEIMRVPWEIVIKLYRKQLGDKKFNTIEEYGKNFVEFIETSRILFPEELQFENLHNDVQDCFESIVEDIQENIKTMIDNGISIDDKITKDVVNRIIKSHYETWKSADLLSNFTEDFVTNFIINHKLTMDKLMKDRFEKLPLTKSNKDKLYHICAWIFCKDRFSEYKSGVVIAGYGSNEVYPVMIDYFVESLVENKLKYKNNLMKIDLENTAYIKPFAQQEMVHTFIEGIDPDLNRFANKYLKKIFHDFPKMIIENLPDDHTIDKDDLQKKLTSASYILYDKYNESMRKYKGKYHVRPILSIVDVLPKDELANMAETLVNLTSFKRKITMANETVGGPIDVAVISKGDGFIWIKRKHYFDECLNQHFRENYFRKDECCEREE